MQGLLWALNDCAKLYENPIDCSWEIWNFHEKVGRKKQKNDTIAYVAEKFYDS